jgi:hypothetical protein
VVDDNFNIVQRPFTKIFNFGEDKAPKFKDDEWVTAVEKINGFMAAATVRDGHLFISTTGSIASDFADLAREHIEKLDWWKMAPGHTHIFEICDETDQHVVPEKFGAYLLGARMKLWEAPQRSFEEEELDALADELGCMRPTAYDMTFRELKESLRLVKHEGYVAWAPDGREIKFKSPYYLATKFFGRKTPERLEKLLDDPREAKRIIDEEYYVAIDYLAKYKGTFIEMTELERMAFLREFFDREIMA